MTVYEKESNEFVSLYSPTVWLDLPDVSVNFTLTEQRQLIVNYQLAALGGSESTTMVTRLMINGIEEQAARAAENGRYVSNNATWLGTLPAGSYEIKVQYRASANYLTSPAFDYTIRAMQVMVLGE